MMTWMRSLFGAKEVNHEHRQYLDQLSDLERRQLEADAMVSEMEARVTILEEGHAHHADP